MRKRDPAGLGRGVLTRWLPVLGQLPAEPPPAVPFTVRAGTTPRRFALQTGLSIKRLTIPAAGAAILFELGVALIPVIAGLAVDRALAAGDHAQLTLWLAVLAADIVVLTTGRRVSALLSMRSTQLVQHRLRATLSTRALHPTGRPVKQPSGALLSTSTNDARRLSEFIGITIFAVAEVVAIGFIAVVLFTIHWAMGLAVVLGAPATMCAVAGFRGPFIRRSGQWQTLLAAAVGQAADLVTGYRVIKGIHAEDEAVRRYRSASQDALGGALHSVVALGRYLIASDAIATCFTVVISVMAAFFAMQGQLSIGELISVVGLAQALLPPLNQLTDTAGTIWAAAIAAAGRILDLLNATPSMTESGQGQRLSLKSPTASVPTLSLRLNTDKHVEVEPGELIGLRGDDRAAAQLVDALLYPEPESEVSVMIDGVPAHQLDTSTYRSQVVVAPHSVTLFSGTIDDNLEILDTPVALRAKALHAAACEDFATDTENALGEHGNRLSGGQRQRVALARALAADAPILVLHDPTTSVDSVTEAVIAERFPRIRRNGSTLLITSSPAMLATCDRVIDLPAVNGADDEDQASEEVRTS